MWFHSALPTETIPSGSGSVSAHGRIAVSMSECARVRVDARLSPAQEAQCVSVEVEG